MVVPRLASHAHHIWDDWGCPDVRSLVPGPKVTAPTHQCLDSSQTRESTEISRHWLRQVSGFLLWSQLPTYLPSFAQPITCPMRSAPFAAPCLALNLPCYARPVVHCFTSLSCPRPCTLDCRGTDMLGQDRLGFSASTLLTAPAWLLCDDHHIVAQAQASSSHGHSELAQNFLAWRNPLHGCGSSACSNQSPNPSRCLDTRPNHGRLLPVPYAQFGKTGTWLSIINFGHRQPVAAGQS